MFPNVVCHVPGTKRNEAFAMWVSGFLRRLGLFGRGAGYQIEISDHKRLAYGAKDSGEAGGLADSSRENRAIITPTRILGSMQTGR